jgi:hypothetical protein
MYQYELLLKIARVMMEVYESTTSAEGTTASILDTKNKYQSDFFNDGTLWILSEVETTFEEMGAYRVKGQAQGVITIDDTFAAACPASIKYAVAPADFSLQQMQQAVSQVLSSTRYMLTNKLQSTAENTEEYTLPTGVTKDVRRVEIATNSTEPYGWYKHPAWDIINGKLVFLRAIPGGGFLMRYHYVDYLAEMETLTSEIPITIDTQHLMWAAIGELYEKFFDRTRGENNEKTQRMTAALSRANAAGAPYIMPRDPIIGDIRG